MSRVEMWKVLQQRFRTLVVQPEYSDNESQGKRGEQEFIFMDQSSDSQPEFLSNAKLETDS